MADVRKAVASRIIFDAIANPTKIPVVSNVKCVRLRRGRNGFGLTLQYCYIPNPSCGMKFEMDEEESILGGNFNERDNASGSDADVSSESSDSPCSRRQHSSSKAVEKAFIKYITPRSPADSAGLAEGDEVINLNNSAVYRKQVSEIENLVQNSGNIDLDIIVGDGKQRYKGLRWNNFDNYASNPEDASENGSSLSLTSGSSDNATSPLSLSPPALTGDRCFVVTCGDRPGREIPEKKNRIFRMHSFPLSSYSDEEPVMESKPVRVPDMPTGLVDVDNTCVGIQRPQTMSNTTIQVKRVDGNDGKPLYDDNISGKGIGLTSSTSSSVLVESLNSSSRSKQACCVTVTTATYTTLASPQTTRGENGYGTKEEGSDDTCDNKIEVTQGDNSVWELRIAQPTHVRSRSPSPAQRRVSYLMATEASASLPSEDWIKPVNNGEATNNVVSLKEESNDDLPRSTCRYQGGSAMLSSDADGGRNFNVEHDPACIVATLASSQPLASGTDKTHYENGIRAGDKLLEFVMAEKRHSLKRKCSVEGPPEIEMEGYLSRKLSGSHGRRSWKQVYVILKAHVLYIYKDKPDQMINSGQEEPISIKSCIIDIAYDYRKRENVFRLTTYNGSVYLFQAKAKGTMMSWIDAIQKNNNPDEDRTGVTKENLIVRRKKDMDNEISSGQISTKPATATLRISGLKKSLSFKSNSGSQPSLKNIKKTMDGESGKATWHNKVVNKMKKIGSTSSSIPQYQLPGYSVGMSLERCPTSKNNPSLPLLVEHCCKVVENKGLDSVGIYRVPGNSANVAALEEELNAKTPDAVDFEEQKWNDANNMGSLLKKFLRKLPEGLVTSELYSNFIEANRKEGEGRMWALKHLIQQLPSAYGETLRFLIRHLKIVSEHSDKNKMEIRNLAIVFGPTIVRTGEDNMMTMVNDMSDRFRIVESFVTNYDWFFDKEPISNGAANHASPTSPPVEEFSRHIVSTNMLNSIEKAAVSYDSNDSRKPKSSSIKLPNFKNFISSNSKKHDGSLDQTATTEPVNNGKFSPSNLSPDDSSTRGGSQPSSPSTGRRKFIKRHHSASHIPSTEFQEDFDRSKSEGEEEDSAFSSRNNHSTKAYSYARPPPPSYQAFRNKLPSVQTVNKEHTATPDNNDSKDFNSLSEETKRRLLKFTLRKKVNEKMQQKTPEVSSAESLNKTQNAVFASSQKAVATAVYVGNVSENRELSHPTHVVSKSETPDEVVVAEPQLKASEIKERFETLSEDNQRASQLGQDKTFTSDTETQLRRRDNPVPWSSSRNFKIYSTPEMNFSQYRPDQVNEWVKDMGQSSSGNETPQRGGERGRSRAKTEEIWKDRSLRRSSVEENKEMGVKGRSLSCQDINLEDDGIANYSRTLSKSSDSTDTSDEEDDDAEEASSKAFNEKLCGILQRSKHENKSQKTDHFQNRKVSKTSRPPSYRASRSSIDKMRAIDPSSKIQSGAVSSIKSLFETGAAQQLMTKSRSSSVSSNSSGSFLSFNSQRRKSTSSSHTISDADVKRRVWESDATATGGKKKQWTEPTWLAKERAIENLISESESSSQDHSDDNNNNVKNHKVLDPDVKQYNHSVTLPVTPSSYSVKEVVIQLATSEEKSKIVVSKSNVEKKIVGERTVKSFHNQPGSINAVPSVEKATPASPNQPSLHEKREDHSSCHVEHVAGYSTPPHKVVHASKSAPSNSPILASKQKPAARSRRRIASDTRWSSTETHHPNVRTFTAPILGTVVTTTTAFALEGFAIKPESKNRGSRHSTKKSEKQATGCVKPRVHRWQPNQRTLVIPSTTSHQVYGSPEIRRKEKLSIPDEDIKRLSTDRSILDQNALHIKELLDEMNTEHSQKMERQKSDTISIEAQRSARKKALRRRLSLGDRENDVVVAAHLPSSNAISERGRRENIAPHSTSKNDIQRNISTVKWVGVSG